MRVIALLATFNEQRFIGACLAHLRAHGLDVYLIDNGSTDATVAIAEQYLGRGLIGIEHVPRHGVYSWRPLLERKERLAAELDADWFMHADPDEFRLPPVTSSSLSDALRMADRDGYNAVNFLEFTFVPTLEQPDHDHARFVSTMEWYYPFLPSFPNRLTAWKRQDHIDLASSGGHRVDFPHLRMYPVSFPMRHYLFLSVPHAIRKYVAQTYDTREVEQGWHRARSSLSAADIRLPSQAMLRRYHSDALLDPSNPRTRHYLFDPS